MNIPFLGAVLRSVLDAGGHRIVNVGKPVDANDVVTKEYMESHGGVPPDYAAVSENASVGAAHAGEGGNPHGTKFEELEEKPNIPKTLAELSGDAAHRTVTDKQKAAWDAKRDKADLNVYEVIRTENTDWTWSFSPSVKELEDAYKGKKPTFEYGNVWAIERITVGAFTPNSSTANAGRDATALEGFDFIDTISGDLISLTITRPRYTDETLGPAKENEKLVSRDTTAAPGALAKFGPDGKLVAATAQDVPGLAAKRDNTNNICAKDEYGEWVVDDGRTDHVFKFWPEVACWTVDEPGRWDGREMPPYGCSFAWYDYPGLPGAYDGSETSLTLGGAGPENYYATRKVVAAKDESYVTKTGVENLKAGGLTDTAIAGVFATPAFKESVATALDEQGAKDKITDVANAAIAAKPMPTEGAVEGSVAKRILALEQGGGGDSKPKINSFEQLKAYIDEKVADTSFASDEARIAKMKSDLVGIEIEDTWVNTGGTTYFDPMIIVNVGKWKGEDGEMHIGAMVMHKYATAETVVFDMANQEVASESTAQDGVYYYGLALGETTVTAAKLTLLDLAVGDALPKSEYKTIYKSAIRDTSRNILQYGHNNWRDSAYRQWLNSNVAKGTSWWTKPYTGKATPSNATTIRGYVQGCSGFNGLNADGTPRAYNNGILKFAKPVYITTSPNYICDGGNNPDPSVGAYETLDLFFLPSGAEMFGNVNTTGGGEAMVSYEGEFSPYWKEATGFIAPNTTYSAARSIFMENGQNSASYVRLRSASRGHSYSVWLVTTSGYLNYIGAAANAYAAAPACVIY